MKKLCVIVLAGWLVAGCGDKSPKPPAPKAEGATEATQNDSKAIAARLAEERAKADANSVAQAARSDQLQRVEGLRNIGKRWATSVEDAMKLGRSNVAPAISGLEAIRGEASAYQGDDCTAKAQATMLRSMSATIEAFNQFKGETGQASDTSRQKLADASLVLNAAEVELNTCLP
jgi:hypothetical protein